MVRQFGFDVKMFLYQHKVMRTSCKQLSHDRVTVIRWRAFLCRFVDLEVGVDNLFELLVKH
jgi:hypothetical protein